MVLPASVEADRLTRFTAAAAALQDAAVNVLCMYIRSPFRLAKRYQRLTHSTVRRSWSAQKKRRLRASLEAFRAEAHLRDGILRAIAARLRTPDTVAPVSGGKTPQQHGVAPGSWSALTYDFSGAVFFYPAQRIRIRLIIVAASTVGGPVLPITRTAQMRCLATASTTGMLCFRGPGTVAGRRWITAPMRGRRSCGSACMSGTPI